MVDIPSVAPPSVLTAPQISDRVMKNVGERYTATYMRWTGSEGTTLEKWGRFTNKWIEQNKDGIIVWCPRVRMDSSSGFSRDKFKELAQAAYPDFGVRIYHDIEKRTNEYLGNPNSDHTGGTSEASFWPILYTNPFTERLIGFETSSVLVRAGYFHTMLATNETTIGGLFASDVTDQSTFVILQPVYGTGISAGQIVGCTVKFTRVQSLISSILKGMQFPARYRGAHVGVFLQVGEGDSNHQLMFDLHGYPNRTRGMLLQEKVTLSEVERRGSKSFSSSIQLTVDKAIVVVASFNPRLNRWTNMSCFVTGCTVSLLVAVLIYGRQVQVLSYKDGMEKATITSTFKSRFVANMSHEIRTPLNGIISTVELLAEERLSLNAKELVATVQSCSNILMGIVNDALDFSKIEVGELRVEASAVSLRDMFLGAMTVMRSAYGLPRSGATSDIRLRLKVAQSVPRETILTDEGRVRQVLCNLVSNALKFTDAGSVTVTAWYELLPQDAALGRESLREMTVTDPAGPSILDRESMLRSLLCKEARLGDLSDRNTPATNGAKSFAHHRTRGETLQRWLPPWWSLAQMEKNKTPSAMSTFLQSLDAPRCRRAMLHIEVTDTGIGMTPQQMERLFKPFSQVHAGSDRSVGGTGLGLAISRSLCESMGGTLECSSMPGVGSSFRFSVLIGVLNATPEALHVGEGGSTSNLTGEDITAALDPETDEDLAQVDARSFELCIDEEWDLIEESTKKKEPRVWQQPQPVAPECREQRCDAPKWDKMLVQRCGNDESENNDVDRVEGRDRRENGDRLHRAITRATSETMGGVSRVRAGKATAATGEDIWFAAVALARKEHAQMQPNRQTSATALRQNRDRARLLIVDDVRVNRMLLRKMLEALEVEVVLVEDGEKAVKICRTTSFTMVLMDLMMPVMSGFEAAGAIRSQEGGLNRKTPIVATTASPGLLGPVECRAAGITDLLVTPLTRKYLFIMVALYSTGPEVERMTAAWARHTAAQKGGGKAPSAPPRSLLQGEFNTPSVFGHRSGASAAEAAHHSESDVDPPTITAADKEVPRLSPVTSSLMGGEAAAERSRTCR